MHYRNELTAGQAVIGAEGRGIVALDDGILIRPDYRVVRPVVIGNIREGLGEAAYIGRSRYAVKNGDCLCACSRRVGFEGRVARALYEAVEPSVVKLVIVPCVGGNVGKRERSALGQSTQYLLRHELVTCQCRVYFKAEVLQK